jgi:hypothetical protein
MYRLQQFPQPSIRAGDRPGLPGRCRGLRGHSEAQRNSSTLALDDARAVLDLCRRYDDSSLPAADSVAVTRPPAPGPAGRPKPPQPGPARGRGTQLGDSDDSDLSARSDFRAPPARDPAPGSRAAAPPGPDPRGGSRAARRHWLGASSCTVTVAGRDPRTRTPTTLGLEPGVRLGALPGRRPRARTPSPFTELSYRAATPAPGPRAWPVTHAFQATTS